MTAGTLGAPVDEDLRRPAGARAASTSRCARRARWCSSATTAAARPRCCGWPPGLLDPSGGHRAIGRPRRRLARRPRGVRQLPRRQADVLRRPVGVGAPRVRRPPARPRRLGQPRRRPARRMVGLNERRRRPPRHVQPRPAPEGGDRPGLRPAVRAAARRRAVRRPRRSRARRRCSSCSTRPTSDGADPRGGHPRARRS